jgi:probable rRNA maturation factor
MRSIVVEVANRQRCLAPGVRRLKRAVREVLSGEGRARAEISVAIVDDAQICQLHRRFLKLDSPTDVLSFVLEDDGQILSGEIVASAETAARVAQQLGWPAADELLLYVVHGALHLAGHDDLSAAQRRKMRQRERYYLEKLGATLPKKTSL